MIKYRIDSKIEGVPYGETVFGYEELDSSDKEMVFHKWCGLKNENGGLYVINRGTYGGSFTNNTIKMSLLRTPVYSALPLEDLTTGEILDSRPVVPRERMNDHIDIGERNYSFRITTEENISREAQIFNEAPQAISFFPSGNGAKCDSVVNIDNPKIIMSSMRKTDDGYKLTLYNSEEAAADATVTAGKTKVELHFGSYELKEIVIKF